MDTPPPHDTLNLTTDVADLGKRLDLFLAENALGTSRSKLRLLILNGLVTLDGQPARPSARLRPGQTIVADLSQLDSLRPEKSHAEEIPLDIIFEDEHLVAVNKPPGMVVHPAKGHWSGTLTAALMHHFEQLSSVGGQHRPGIVHRLDRDTSGVIIVAKTDRSHLKLTRQFEKRTVEKRYLAVVSPPPDRDRDYIEQPIGTHPYQREKMAIRSLESGGKSAKTFYEVVERIRRFAILHVLPHTGRTHQIRIHLTHIGCPVLADPLYSGRSSITRGWISTGRDDDEVILDRQALHASSISFDHPESQKRMQFEAALPDDMSRLIEVIRQPAS